MPQRSRSTRRAAIILVPSLALVLLGSHNPGEHRVHEANQLRAKATELRQGGDYSSALQHLLLALELRPGHPSIMYEVAQLNQLLNRKQAALDWLRKVADMGMVYPAGRDAHFRGLTDEPVFLDILKTFQRNAAPLMKSRVAFTITQDNPVSEGLAFDPALDRFFIGSVAGRQILVRHESGREEVFAHRADSVWSILGMTVDEERNVLWACTGAVAQMSGYDSTLDGSSALLKFDLQDGSLIKRYAIGHAEEKHLIGDLTVTPDGDVYATDSRAPVIFRVNARTDKLEEYLRSGEFVNLQGIDYAPEDEALYVADYSRGIFHIDLRTKNLHLVQSMEGTTVLGIDGLYAYKEGLIAVQNGVNPNRVMRFGLDGTKRKIISSEVLEANHPAFDEPTLGVVVGSDFFFVANSQWEKASRSDGGFDRTVILQLDLR